MHHGYAGLFWSAVKPELWPPDADHRREIMSQVEPPYGDRRQEIVFIGQNMDAAEATAALDACLLTDAELAAGQAAWSQYTDPFPAWAPVIEEALA